MHGTADNSAFSHGDGLVYILASADGRLSKIGRTTGAPLRRAADYGRVHGIRWVVHWSAETRLAPRVENDIHQALSRYQHRIGSAQEIFQVAASTAREVALRFLLPRKHIHQLRADALARLLRQHELARFDTIHRNLLQDRYRFWRRRRIAVDDRTIERQRLDAEARIATMSESELRTADTEHETTLRRQVHVETGLGTWDPYRMLEARNEWQAREAIAARWRQWADYWRRSVQQDQAAIDAYEERTLWFDRLIQRLSGQSPISEPQWRVAYRYDHFSEAVMRDHEIRAQIPEACRALVGRPYGRSRSVPMPSPPPASQ